MEAKDIEKPFFSLFDGCDHVITKEGSQVKLKDLQGKTIGLLFAASWSKPCNDFIAKMVPAYTKIKEKTSDFEVILVTENERPLEFNRFLNKMPWLAVPLAEKKTNSNLIQHFKAQKIPQLIVLAPDGKKTLTRVGRSLITRFSANAFPFTEEHIMKITIAQDAKVAKLPQEFKFKDHEHPLKLVNDPYTNHGLYGCNACKSDGCGWGYHCETCGYDLHPACADPRFDLTVDIEKPKGKKESPKGEVVRKKKVQIVKALKLGFKALGVFLLAFLGRFLIKVDKDSWKDLSTSSSSSSSWSTSSEDDIDL